MKRVTGFFTLLLCMAMLMTGCSGKGDGQTEAASDAAGTNAAAESQTAESQEPLTRGEYKAPDYCTIEEYKGLKFAEADIKASDDEVQNEIDQLLANAQETKEITEDRAVKEGDVVNIDYTGYVDGETFDGGSASGSDLQIGSGRFIDGFEDGLIGHKKGEEVSLNLTFPENYSEELAGKDVVFEVKINKIQEYTTPEYTDEFVAANTSYDTKADYEQYVRDGIRENNLTSALADKLMANAAFADEYPESLNEYYRQTYVNYYNSVLQSAYGITLDEYLDTVQEDLETFLTEEVGADIEQAIQEDLILSAVAEQEGIRAEGDDYDAFLQEQADQYSMDKDELLKTYGEDTLEYAYISKQAYQLIYDSVVVE